ncbi:MAG TPA: DUF1731 domain-containing protein [Phycisphaerales bacterium]|nr:DUF1731 domain-containing protein [Phycisphaerales bacterium]
MAPPSQRGRIVIAGGSGFLGMSLAAHLADSGCPIAILSRHAPRAAGPWQHIPWDARTLGDWSACLDGAGALVNLVGRSVNCVKTPGHCDQILRSRVEATRVLGEACRAVASPPPVWVQMSTAHIYGDPPTAVCDESSAFGYGLAPTVGRAWEEAFVEAMTSPERSEGSATTRTRGVILRTSFVIGRANAGGAGALGTLGALARAGLGGRVGTGTQGMSWIHERDMNRLFERAIGDEAMHGAYIAVSPSPVSQREFMRELRRHAGGLGALGIGLPAFAWMVRLGAPLVLRTDPDLALYGRYLRPKRLLDERFEFEFATLGGALADLHARGRSATVRSWD